MQNHHVFTPAEIKLAEDCCKELWYGFDYRTGERITSDAWLLNRFAGKFLAYLRSGTGKKITKRELDNLSEVCGLARSNKRVAVDLKKLNKCLFGALINAYGLKARGSSKTTRISFALTSVNTMSKELPTQYTKNKPALASRLLFFALADTCVFNLNSNVAGAIKVKATGQNYPRDYFKWFAKLLVANSQAVSTLQLPPPTEDIDPGLWTVVAQTDWWARRVLDLAVLIHTKCETPRKEMLPQGLASFADPFST